MLYSPSRNTTWGMAPPYLRRQYDAAVDSPQKNDDDDDHKAPYYPSSTSTNAAASSSSASSATAHHQQPRQLKPLLRLDEADGRRSNGHHEGGQSSYHRQATPPSASSSSSTPLSPSVTPSRHHALPSGLATAATTSSGGGSLLPGVRAIAALPTAASAPRPAPPMRLPSFKELQQKIYNSPREDTTSSFAAVPRTHSPDLYQQPGQPSYRRQSGTASDPVIESGSDGFAQAVQRQMQIDPRRRDSGAGPLSVLPFGDPGRSNAAAGRSFRRATVGSSYDSHPPQRSVESSPPQHDYRRHGATTVPSPVYETYQWADQHHRPRSPTWQTSPSHSSSGRPSVQQQQQQQQHAFHPYRRPHSTSPDHGRLLHPSEQEAQGGVVPRRRGKLPRDVTDLLRAWLMDHAAHPYPNEDEKRNLCDRTGLTISQVSNWFINARRRILAPQMAGNNAANGSSHAGYDGSSGPSSRSGPPAYYSHHEQAPMSSGGPMSHHHSGPHSPPLHSSSGSRQGESSFFHEPSSRSVPYARQPAPPPTAHHQHHQQQQCSHQSQHQPPPPAAPAHYPYRSPHGSYEPDRRHPHQRSA